MKMIVRRTALAVCTLVLAMILPTAASAVCTGFVDVPESADCYESVMYLAGHEIAAGTGNDCFSPEQLITVEQWAVMLCRAYGVEAAGDSWQDVSRSSVVEAYRQGWLNTTAVTAPRSPMCCSVLVESALAAADVPVYDSTLYEEAASLSSADNILRVGRELGLCADDADANALVTRGEAAIILHAPRRGAACAGDTRKSFRDQCQCNFDGAAICAATDSRYVQCARLEARHRLQLHSRTGKALRRRMHRCDGLCGANDLCLGGRCGTA